MENNQPDEGSHKETYFRLNIHDIGYYHPGKNLVPAARFETCELVFRRMTAGVRALRDEGCKNFPVFFFIAVNFKDICPTLRPELVTLCPKPINFSIFYLSTFIPSWKGKTHIFYVVGPLRSGYPPPP